MSRRLVIPAGETSSSASPIERSGVLLTWGQVAELNGADGIENLGSPWCVDNEVDGLGLASEKPPTPPFVPPTPSNMDLAADALDAIAADAQASTLSDVRSLGEGLAQVAALLKGSI